MVVINPIHAEPHEPTKNKLPLYRNLYVQVIAAIVIGVFLGHFNPELATKMKPLGDAFIKLIKMMIGPIIFCTIVTGIASMDNMKQAGSVAIKAMLYFALLSGFSLFLGMVVANVIEPGVGMNIDPSTLSTDAVKTFVGDKVKTDTVSEFLMHVIPTTAVDAFAKGDILQVLFFAILFACAVISLGERAKVVVNLLDEVSHILFKVIGFIMKVAPIGAFGAMAFTIGQYGIASLIPLSKLLLCFYITCLLFVFVVLGVLLSSIGLSIFKFVAYIKEEIFIVFGTCSSETVFPRMIDKLTALGCKKSVVGMVLPTGYSFNLDGTAIYLTMAAIFLAQATNTPMTWEQQLSLLAIMMITSKGAAGVVGTAFVALAATLATVGHIPVASIALILGIDRFMAEGRAVTNLIGNGVATLFVSKLENSLDIETAKDVLSGKKQAKLETDS
jgi:aerobic C4-dicarboxylate transport protein